MVKVLVDKLKQLTDWIDSKPSVPVALGAFAVGAFIPTKLVVLGAVVLGVYVLANSGAVVNFFSPKE
jgi:hypothetical protein